MEVEANLNTILDNVFELERRLKEKTKHLEKLEKALLDTRKEIEDTVERRNRLAKQNIEQVVF